MDRVSSISNIGGRHSPANMQLNAVIQNGLEQNEGVSMVIAQKALVIA